MFDLERRETGEVVLKGRFDAAQREKAQALFDEIHESVTLDCSELDYISSAGLGVLLKTQKRLLAEGGRLKLIGVNSHLRDVFKYSGFDRIFEIEPG